MGYEVSGDYPRFTYRQNEIVWYLDQLEEVTFVRYVCSSLRRYPREQLLFRILEMFLLWMVLYNYIIPLSMYVCLEMQKFLASLQFQWDRELYDEERGQPAQCHTSDINEELGLVTHLFR